MYRITFLPFLCLAALLPAAHAGRRASTGADRPAADAAFRRASLLEGCWLQERDGQRIEESWSTAAGSTMLGLSRTIRGDRTSNFEFMLITTGKDGLEYVAFPDGVRVEPFLLTGEGAVDELVFARAQADFPQRIRYRRRGDMLDAQIEGGGQKMGWNYRRRPCPLQDPGAQIDIEQRLRSEEAPSPSPTLR